MKSIRSEAETIEASEQLRMYVVSRMGKMVLINIEVRKIWQKIGPYDFPDIPHPANKLHL